VKKIILLLVVLGLFSAVASQANMNKSRLVDFDYRVAFKGLEDFPEDAKKLDVWLPMLPNTPYQEIEEVTISPKGFAQITEDKVYNNKLIHFTFETPVDPSLEINIKYKVRRHEFSNKPGDSSKNLQGALPQEQFDKYLKASRLVTLSPEVKEIAKEVTKDKTTTIEKARAIYDYVFENVSYDKAIPGYGQGDTQRVCNLKAGNCTDFHSLFLSLSRASDIPAKFVIGIPIAEEQQGELSHYHCWAEFYEEKLGWIPVDISEAWKDNSKREYHFGAVDENRLEFSRGRDIVLEPKQQGEPLNYFIYPYAELDGKEFKKMGVLFKYQKAEDTIDKVGDLTKVLNFNSDIKN